MLAEDKAKELFPANSWNGQFNLDQEEKQRIFISGYNEAKKLNEVLECPFCNSKDIKWAFRLVKQCKNCNEYFNSKS